MELVNFKNLNELIEDDDEILNKLKGKKFIAITVDKINDKSNLLINYLSDIESIYYLNNAINHILNSKDD